MSDDIEYPVSMADYVGVYTYKGNDFVWDVDLNKWVLVPVSG